ncbi:MAG: hypothetical protein MR428_00015 [Mesosutterella sp.]|nr:hypothetical protein [Mesosutterella sp.]
MTTVVPADPQDFDIGLALQAEPNAKGVFIASASQYPLGAPIDEGRTGSLLDWARRSGGWIIEDGTERHNQP